MKKKGMTLLLLAVAVVVFPSLTLAVKINSTDRMPSLVDVGLDKKIIARCVECH